MPRDKAPVYRVSHADWLSVACKLFGKDPMQWRFRCVSCGHVQTAGGLVERRGLTPENAINVVYVACEGRYAGATSSIGGPDGCDWTVNGLLSFADVYVTREGGGEQPVFMFEHPDAHAALAAAAGGG